MSLRLKKAIASLAGGILLFGLVVMPVANAQTYNDLPSTHWGYDYVEAQVLQGYWDVSDNFSPDQGANRAMLAKLGYKVAYANGIVSGIDTGGMTFVDVAETDWYYPYAATLANVGIMGGYKDANGNLTGYFGGGDAVTRAQALKVMELSAGVPMNTMPSAATIFPDVSTTDWHVDYVSTGYNSTIVDGYSNGNFGPNDPVTRVQLAKMIGGAENPVDRDSTPSNENTNEDVTNENTNAVVVPKEGTLDVSLSSNTPASATVPKGAKVDYTYLTLTAGSGNDVVVNNLTITRTGIGSASDFTGLYLYDGDNRLTNRRSVSTSTNTAAFNNLGYVVPAGSTKVLTVKGEMSTSAVVGDQNALGVALDTDVDSTAETVLGSFPLYGNLMTVGGQTVGKVDIESNGGTYTRKVGEANVEVTNFTVHVNSTENAVFNGVTLYNSGREVFSDLKLYRGTDMVSECSPSGSYFICNLDTPYEIEKGNSVGFVGKATIGGRKDDTGTLMARYKADVDVVGNTYGHQLIVDNTVGDSSNSYCEEVDSSPLSNTTTVEAGQFTVSFTGPIANDVSKNTNNVVLGTYNITSQADVDVERTTVTISGTNLIASDVSDLELVCGNSIVASWSTVTIGDNASTDYWNLAAGQTTSCELRIDITNTAGGDETIVGTLKDMTSSSNWVIKDENGDALTDIVPSGNITGNTMTVTAASLALNVASNPAAGTTYVKNTQDVNMVNFTFTAGAASDVKTTSVKLTAHLDSDQNSFADATDKNQLSSATNIIGSVTIYDGETALADAKSLTVGSSDITVTFSDLNWTIPAGTTKTLSAKVNLTNTDPLDSNNDDIALTIAAAGDVSAEYGSGTSLTPTLSGNNNTPTIYQTITAYGTLTMAQDANTPSTNLVVAGNTDVPHTKVKFTATSEAFTVTKLRALVSANASNYTGMSLEYTDSEGDTVTTAPIPFVGGVADFSGLGIYVPKDGDTVVTLKGNMNTIAGGATNTNAANLGVDYDTSFEAIGLSSSKKLTSAGSANVTGNNMTLYQSVPTIAFASDTPEGNLIPSVNTLIGKIVITADIAKDITFENADGNSMTVILSATGGAGLTADDDGVSLKDELGNTLCSDTIDLGTDNLVCDFATNSLTVSAGTSKTLYLYLDTTELSAEGNTVQAWLDDGTTTYVDWGINGAGSYNHADILFRGDKYAGALVKP